VKRGLVLKKKINYLLLAEVLNPFVQPVDP
jgi:hypothetical protein